MGFKIVNAQKKRVELNSIIIAVLLCLNFISVSMSTVISLSNILVMLTFFLFFLSLYINKGVNYKYLYFIALSMIFPIVALIIAGFHNNDAVTYFMYYIQNGIMLTYCVTHKFDVLKIFKTIVVLFAIFSWGTLFYSEVIHSGGSLMGWSYAITPLFLASVYILFFSNASLKWKIASALLLLVYVLYVISFLSRGAVLAVSVFVLVLFLNNSAKVSIVQYLRKAFICIIILILIYNYKSIILNLNDLFQSMSIEFSFLNEMAIRIQDNTIYDGRFLFYERSLQSFLGNPIFGNGLAAFARMYSSNYDHNIFLQLLNEGGIFFASIHFVLIIRAVFIVLTWSKKYYLNYKIFLLFLICNSLIRLLFSYVFWREQGYWLLIFLSFIHKEFYVFNNQKSSKLDNNNNYKA